MSNPNSEFTMEDTNRHLPYIIDRGEEN